MGDIRALIFCSPLIGGHEGVGDVVAIGKHTQESPVKVGDRVGIKWLAYSCLQCEFVRLFSLYQANDFVYSTDTYSKQCRKGLEQGASQQPLYLIQGRHNLSPIPRLR